MIHYVALWLLVRVAGRLPLPLLDAIASLGGTVAWWWVRRLREVTRDHMRHALGPNAPQSAVDRAARESVRSVARGYAEFAHLPHLTPDLVRARITTTDGMDALREALAEGHGAIIVSAHLGAPEVISHAAPTFGVDLAGLSEPLHPQPVHDFVHAVRAMAGVRYIPVSLAGLREARAHLAAGGALGILVDRDVIKSGRPYAFLGERASMPTGAVDLALRTGAPIVAVWCFRKGAGRYRLAARRLPLPIATGDRARDTDAGMRVVLDALEDAIRSAPGQWGVTVPVWSGLVADR